MSDRRIALVAVDSLWRDPKGTFYSFSYGIEKLRASLHSAHDLADVDVLLLDLRSGDPEEYFEQLRAFRPTLVGLSTYIWSLDVFAGLTERLRQHDPDVVIVAGGPAARRTVLDLAPHRALRDRLDAVITGEGEEILRELAREHRTPGWQKRVHGLDLPGHGLWRTSPPAERPELDAYPSPYQLDLAPLRKTGYVETFRGCPIHCAFCQWGEQKSDRVHSVEYLARHLEGLRRSDALNVFFLDAAFNLSPRAFRALVAAESEVHALADKTVHGHLYPTYLKEEHLTFFEGLGQVQVSVGIQSFDEKVLERLGRPFDIERFQSVLRLMRGRLDVDIELIFGLPGDNPLSFRRTLETALELGNSVKIFRCLVLPDALIERSEALSIDFDPRTFSLRSAEGWTPEALESEWEAVVRLAEQARDPILNDDWVGWVIDTPEARARGAANVAHAPSVVTSRSIDEAGVLRLGERIDAAAHGWALERVHRDRAEVLFELRSPAGPVTLTVLSVQPGKRSFLVKDGLAYSHRGDVDAASAPLLRRVIDVVHRDALALLGEELGELAS